MIKTIYTQTRISEEGLEKNNGQKYNVSKKYNLSKAKVLPVCYRCAQVPKNGLYDGFRVEEMFFCSSCQQELFTAEQGSPEYQEFIYLIKEILL